MDQSYAEQELNPVSPCPASGAHDAVMWTDTCEFGQWHSSPCSLSAGLALPVACAFLWQLFYVTSTSSIPGSLLRLQSRSHRFKHSSPRAVGSLPCHTLAGLPHLPVKCQWKLRWPYNLNSAFLKNQHHMYISSVCYKVKQYLGPVEPWL